jgi:hypothetical protein
MNRRVKKLLESFSLTKCLTSEEDQAAIHLICNQIQYKLTSMEVYLLRDMMRKDNLLKFCTGLQGLTYSN